MAHIALLLHGLLCLMAVALMFVTRRASIELRAFGPLGAREDLNAFRRTARRLGWTLTALVGALVGAVILGALWASVWRNTPIGQVVLGGLLVPAGLNVLVAFAGATRQQWSPAGSIPGLLWASLWSAVAMGLFALTLFWRFG